MLLTMRKYLLLLLFFPQMPAQAQVHIDSGRVYGRYIDSVGCYSSRFDFNYPIFLFSNKYISQLLNDTVRAMEKGYISYYEITNEDSLFKLTGKHYFGSKEEGMDSSCV